MKEQNKKNKKARFSFNTLIYNDKYLMLVSLILAFIVWIGASISSGTTEDKTIKIDLPVKLGDEVSQSLGMQYYSLQDAVELSVTVSGNKYVVGQIDENDLTIRFDTSNVNKTGEHTIPIIVSSKSDNFNVSSYYPQSIECYFDASESKTFDIQLQNEDLTNSLNVAEGYALGTPVFSEKQVIVTGPKTYVDRIQSANVNVYYDSDDALTEPYTTDSEISFGSTGDLQSNYLTITSKADKKDVIKTISVTVPVLKRTTLSTTVNFENMPKKLPSDAVKISYSKNALDAGILDSANIDKAQLGTIDFGDIPLEGANFNFNLNNLNGITVLEKGLDKVNVKVSVNKDVCSSKNVSISKSNVVIDDIPKGYKAVVTSVSAKTVTAIGPSADVEKVTSGNVKLHCDVSKRTQDNKYSASAIIDSNDTCWVYGNYSVVIELVKE